MIRSGLVSISFRELTAERIIDLAVKASLDGIEWGGDIHAPHGDAARAEEVGRRTRDAGLAVAAYGSYYRLGVSELEGLSFNSVLDSAVALEAPTVRVWAGTKGTKDATDEDRARAVADAHRVADLAGTAGKRVCIEYHEGTLTDHHKAALWLHETIDRPNVDLLWQPPYYHDFKTDLDSLRAMLTKVSNIHVYWWTKGAKPGDVDRHPLKEAAQQWSAFFDLVNTSDAERFALLEYVKGDTEAQFIEDADTLRSLLTGTNG